MSSGRFAALRDDDSDSDDTPEKPESRNVHIPSYEDLSSHRADEETVLGAIYGPDFSREDGPWGCPKLEVQVRPPDLPPEKVGTQLKLSVQLGKQYPYVVPTIQLKNVQGLSKNEQLHLAQQLKERANELAEIGSVMVCEFVQIVEDYLLEKNVDPTMSAWEQMKAREAREKEEELKGEDRSVDLEATSPSKQTVDFEVSSSNVQPRRDAASADVEWEMARQREAIAAVNRGRQKLGNVFDQNLADEDENNAAIFGIVDEDDEFSDGFDDENEDDGPLTNLVGSSRYKTDFIELGILGRGGGGEVVKVRNRLDRRIYAIKKIILESERGPFAKFAAIQNRKLRREVKTISRMTHKNIVRYYQAWQEGGIGEDTIAEVDGAEISNSPKVGTDFRDENDELHESEASGDHTSYSNPSSSSGTSSPWSDEDSSSGVDHSIINQESHRASLVNLLEHENDHGFENPLLAGLGFQNSTHYGLYRKKAASKSSEHSSEGDSIWDESSVKVDHSKGNQSILYIQMEYCATTLRKLIDEQVLTKMDTSEMWRLTRQIVEALCYIHSRNIIHRDMKPGNIFLDSEGNIRMGDFGLATRRPEKPELVIDESASAEASALYDDVMDVSRLMGSSNPTTSLKSQQSTMAESITGGVGTIGYRAPEQEASSSKNATKGSGSYNMQVDIYSLGIILFEMFHPPFETYMERSQTLSALRGETSAGDSSNGDFDEKRNSRFPGYFIKSTPENAQRIILWCLERDPSKRPTAQELLKSELLPRKMEVEQRYLEEALHLLTDTQSEGYMQILESLFQRPTSDLVELTFDTDISAKANSMATSQQDKRAASPSQALVREIKELRAGAMSTSLSMSNSSLLAATSALRRARNAGNVGKGVKGIMKRSTQRVAGVLAMSAATSAAIEGNLDGVHGADPRLVDTMKGRLTGIFQSHGAVRLKSPLLRPRPNTKAANATVSGPAELMSNRGSVLLLPEDLTAPFARAVGRGGSATSNIKRYEIGTVYHKSAVGGHPREAMEATFDIIQDDPRSKGQQLEAEILFTVCQVMSSFPTNSSRVESLPFEARSPLWYLRLTHTRLSDSILELCGVPAKESLRRACLHILSRLTSSPPSCLIRSLRAPLRRKRSNSCQVDVTGEELLEKFLGELIDTHQLQADAVHNLRIFVSSCMPLPGDANDAIERILAAVSKLRPSEAPEADRRRLVRDIGKHAKHLSGLIQLIGSIGMSAQVESELGSGMKQKTVVLNKPLFISIDLGLRQRRKHYHGQLLFQCIVLPDNYFDQCVSSGDAQETSDMILSTGKGFKVAEGGRYDDLVRKSRPPGNFGSALFHEYTAAAIPKCVGVRFAVGKLVELAYLDAALASVSSTNESSLISDTTKFSLDKHGIDVLRTSLAHPFNFIQSAIRCMVTGVSAFEEADSTERFIVASRLWSEGIAAEYMAQSGVISSVIKENREEMHGAGTSGWSLEDMCAVCAILKIPFVVIVDPHLLKDKGSVRLRRVLLNDSTETSSSTSQEHLVGIETLATLIRELSEGSHGMEETGEEQGDFIAQTPAAAAYRDSNRSVLPSLDCIYINHGQYYEETDKHWSTSNWKSVKKTMKGIVQRGESFISVFMDPFTKGAGQPIPIFAVTETPFWVLREFGTCLMKRENEQSTSSTCIEVGENYPAHKRALKTLGSAVDSYMKRKGFWTGGTQAHVRRLFVPILLYSKKDDRFDMMTLECYASGGGTGSDHNRIRRK